MVSIVKVTCGHARKNYPNADNMEFYFASGSDKYKNAYYTTSGGYSDNPPKERGRSALGYMVYNIIKGIILGRYNIDGLTWYDVWRRLSGAKYHALVNEGNENLMSFMMNYGLGFKISYVLNRNPVTNTGIVSTKNSSIEDTIYIQDADRNWLLNYTAKSKGVPGNA